MAIEKIDIEKYMQLSNQHPVIDVRSPGEFNHAQIPNAYSLPLFTDEERKIVGTTYKQQSREAAIKIGLDFFGVKMKPMVEEVEQLNHKTVLVHCWRGGMRSAAIAWLLDMYGFKVYTLTGGYKSFRNWVLKQFDREYKLKILGGYTGSGKTIILHELYRMGNTVIDLEKLANHKGSAFGAIGEKPQPTQEMFENLLSMKLFEVPHTSDIWIEDESQRIGRLIIPNSFWEKMRTSPVYFVDIPFEERLNYLIETYGNFDKEELSDSILRIQKRLGGLETKNATNLLAEKNNRECFRILLNYYDKLYTKGLHNRENLSSLLNKIDCENVNVKQNIQKILYPKVQA
ncbi:MAG TPA: tRNA 2-selenouridine(34) synthase MnmH [Chitinophagaceae bacterium]|nr:tRNA 2-selenouridine(34) synthase MnmH [Chitinophagaceae bacterium]